MGRSVRSRASGSTDARLFSLFVGLTVLALGIGFGASPPLPPTRAPSSGPAAPLPPTTPASLPEAGVAVCDGRHVMNVHFYDVGQGLAVLVNLPDGRHVLVDAGDNPKRPGIARNARPRAVIS